MIFKKGDLVALKFLPHSVGYIGNVTEHYADIYWIDSDYGSSDVPDSHLLLFSELIIISSILREPDEV